MSKVSNGTSVGQNQANDAQSAIDLTAPYIATIRLRGTSTILFHRWSDEAVAAKANAAKGSKAKKTDNIESYVYRNEKNEICIPGTYLRGAIIGAAKFRQDPRSPRKSAMDLFKAALVPLTELASLGTAEWDFLDSQRVVVQRSAVTRVRPAFLAGWEATFELMCNLPHYIPQDVLLETITDAGRLIGLADFRPTYGRFAVVSFVVA